MKPMLAAKASHDWDRFPMIVSPKLDGIRCLIVDGVAMSRSLKPIPNKHVQQLFGRRELDGLDGELIVGSPTAKDVFSTTSSGVMAIDGRPDVYFHVFDDFAQPGPFGVRLRSANQRLRRLATREERTQLVTHVLVSSIEDLLALENQWVVAGFEGIMLRHPDGPYKHGRSTEKEGWLLKLKRFEDAEARVIGFQELMHNSNEAKTNELGQKERSSKRAGLVGKGVLGALLVRDVKTKVEFDIGTGFTQANRESLWAMRSGLLGKVVRYKHFASGAKDKPRFPVFLGFRDPIDM